METTKRLYKNLNNASVENFDDRKRRNGFLYLSFDAALLLYLGVSRRVFAFIYWGKRSRDERNDPVKLWFKRVRARRNMQY